MNKTFGIIGAVLFVAAVVIGYFCDFAGSAIVTLALSGFGVASLVISTIGKIKEEGKFTWKTIVVIVLALVGGALCAIGGFSDSIFEIISGAVIAILSVIFGLLSLKK